MTQESFTQALLEMLDETFETHHGIYLDRGTSFFPTLDQLNASEASIPIGGRCATIAAQVEHVIFYLEVLMADIQGQPTTEVDWGEIWGRVSGVTAVEWEDLKGRLKKAYLQLKTLLQGIGNWEQNDALSGSMAILVHTAYHLGEVRQALCTVGRQREPTITG